MNCYGPFSLLLNFIAPSKVDTACLVALEMGASVPQVSFKVYFCFFLLTCTLEAPIYFFVARRSGVAWAGALLQLLWLNLATHPFVFFLVPRLMVRAQQNTAAMIFWGEFFAIALEVLLLRLWWRYSFRTATLTSLAANLFSWGFGSVLIEYFFETLRT